MKLLGFQREAIDALVKFAGLYAQLSSVPALASSGSAANAAWGAAALPAAAGRAYSESRSSNDDSVPNAAIVIPTGGGKTITGAFAGIEVARALGRAGIFLVWMVPSDAIFAQTEEAFGRGGWLKSAIQESYGLETILKTRDSVWSSNDFREDAVTVLLVSMQSLIGDANILRFYRSADLVSGLDIWEGREADPSLAALLEVMRPIFVVDEAHKAYTQSGRAFFNRGNFAEFIVELTATPKPYSDLEYPNICYAASAAQLVEESLLKNPLEYHHQPTSAIEEMLAACVQVRNDLEVKLQADYYFIPPKVLVSGSYTHERYRDHERSAQAIRESLIAIGVPEEHIAIKSSTVDELTGLDLDGPEAQVRYIITSRALAEGWDVKSVFVVALLNEIGAPLTTFQLVGRGLRQPNREYFEQGELNKLHVFTNSGAQDDALDRLSSFLESEGLTGLWVDVVSPGVVREVPLPAPISIPCVEAPDSSVFRQLWLSSASAGRLRPLPLQDLLYGVELDASTTALDLSHESAPTASRWFTPGEWEAPPTAWKSDFLLAGARALSSAFKDSIEVGAYLSLQYDAWLSDPDSERLFTLPPLIAVREVLKYLGRAQMTLKDEVFFSQFLPQATFAEKEFPSRTALPASYSTPDALGTAPFSHSVFGDFPKSILNEEERPFARFLDGLGVPWFRNPSLRGWYALPLLGGHMYPDFGLLLDPRKGQYGAYERIILIETKGAHLVSNEDSDRKRRVCERVTEQSGGVVTALFGTFPDMQRAVQELTSSSSAKRTKTASKKV